MDSSERTKFQDFWIKSAQEDLDTARDLYGLKRFSACLFFCHLALEKVIKALYIKNNDSYPLPIHDLVKLAEKTKLKLQKNQKKQLDEITTFNIEARYDVVKDKLYKKATTQYTKEYLNVTKNLFSFFKKML